MGRFKSGDRDSGAGGGNPIQKWATPCQERWVRMKRWGNPLEGRGYRWPEDACRGRAPYAETSRGPPGLRRISFRTGDVSTASGHRLQRFGKGGGALFVAVHRRLSAPRRWRGPP